MEYNITGLNGKIIGKKVSTCECVDVSLENDEVFTLSGDQRETLVQVVSGSLWVTQEDDPEDYRIAEGGVFEISCTGRVVLQGLPAAKFRLAPADNDPALKYKRATKEAAF
jgi:redox-sensitive bicupin YhaK (pirin superfamily)